MRILSTLVMGSLVSTLAFSAPRPGKPHLESEMTSAEYEALLSRAPKSKVAADTDPELDAILKLGKRNLVWLNAVNAARTPETRLPLSTPETQRGIPLETPSVSSPSIIKKKLADLKAAMPESMVAVLFDTTEVPADTTGVEDAVFLQSIRDIDRLYQNASRWLLQVPYLEDYKAAAANDVRGYFYLNKTTHLKIKLRAWQMLPAAERATLSGYLVNICLNNDKALDACKSELAKAEHKMFGVYKFYSSYWPKAVKLWANYFAIPKTRPEFVSNTNTFVVPFRDPKNAAVAKWFEENVEDEWKWTDWQLDIQYTTEAGPLAHLEFEEGVTPHVNDVAGDTITMDANRSLQEYTSRWTIRHEFGHVLGFPDCYVEFYDVNQEAMVNYQLDITNLMCSRKGKFKQIHFDELKRAYTKN